MQGNGEGVLPCSGVEVALLFPLALLYVCNLPLLSVALPKTPTRISPWPTDLYNRGPIFGIARTFSFILRQ